MAIAMKPSPPFFQQVHLAPGNTHPCCPTVQSPCMCSPPSEWMGRLGLGLLNVPNGNPPRRNAESNVTDNRVPV